MGKLCFGVDSEGVFDFPIFAKNLILFFEIIMTLASTCSSLDACLKVTELLWHDSNLNTLCLDISWFAVNKNKDWIWLFLSVLFLYFLYFQVDTKNYKKVILFLFEITEQSNMYFVRNFKTWQNVLFLLTCKFLSKLNTRAFRFQTEKKNMLKSCCYVTSQPY